MKLSRLAALIGGLGLSLSAAGAQPQAAANAVTVQQASAVDPGHAPITIAIWAPPASAPPAPQGRPLIVISHGTGAGPLSHSYTAVALADAGFAVVAPMHPADNFQDQSSVGRPEWFANRSRHISRVIDHMLTTWPGQAQLNPQRVGIFGFSAGGTTALVAAGGTLDLSRVAPHCAAHPEFVCTIMAPPTAAAPAPELTHDPRIAAAFVAAPGLGFAFEPAGLARVRIPVQLWIGAADETVPFATNGGVEQRLLPQGADLHSVENAVHLSFLAPCTPETPPFLCQDRPGFDRRAFHEQLNEAVVGFFLQQLWGT